MADGRGLRVLIERRRAQDRRPNQLYNLPAPTLGASMRTRASTRRNVSRASPTDSFAASVHVNPGRATFFHAVRPYNRPMEPLAAESPATMQAELAELRAKLAESHALLDELRERDSHLRMAM